MNISFKTTIQKVLEAFLVLALVVLAFIGILTTLNLVFPTGQSIFELVRSGEGNQNPFGADGASRDFHLVTGLGDEILGEGGSATAVLSRKERSVKSKRSTQIAWENATEGMYLYNRDAVQTFERSSADLTFSGNSSLELGENSLIVLRKLNHDVFLRENRTVVVLMGGQVTGKVAAAKTETSNIEVVAPGAVARLPSLAKKGQPTRFKMTTRPDDTSVLSVLEGTADLVVDGKSLEIGPNQIVKVQPGRSPVFLTMPPWPPAPVSPEEGVTFYFRDISPKVSFQWSGARGVSEYRFALSKDPRFEHIVLEDVVKSTRFTHGNLKPGDYYWQVSSISSDWEDKPGPVRHFKVVQDLEPPDLHVEYPGPTEGSEVLKLTGITEPEARVYVDGLPVKVNEQGRFDYNFSLQRGSNVIVVEAVDKVGNVTYFSKIVQGEF